MRVDEETCARLRKSCRTPHQFSAAQPGQLFIARFRILARRLIWIWIAIVPASPVLADGDTIAGVEFRAHRPANFYMQTYARDEAVCGPILASLSEPYTRGHERREEQRALMYNRYIVGPWRKKLVDWVNADGTEVTERKQQLITDINNDGTPDAIYRWTTSLSRTDYDAVVISLAPSANELSDAVLSYDEFRTILGPAKEGIQENHLVISRKTVDPATADLPSHGMYWIEIIVVDGRQYLLASSAIYWKPTAITSVFLFDAPRDLKLICEFRGTIDISRHASGD